MNHFPEPQAHFDPHTITIQITFPDGRGLTVQKHDLQITHFSHGPGGQNVNKHMNGVQLIYRIPEAFRRREKKTQEIVIRSGRERSLEHNLHHAFRELARDLQDYFYVQPPRFTTRVPLSAKIERHHDKKMQSLKKQFRRETMTSDQ